MGYINVLNFDMNNPDCILEVVSDISKGKTFETLEDVGKVMKEVSKYNEQISRDILTFIDEYKPIPSPYVLSGTCPVCGHSTFVNNDDYQTQATFCLVCGTHDNQFLHWDDMRSNDEGVLIWNSNFDGVSVEDIATLSTIKFDLETGIRPDTLKPLIPREPWFKDEYIDATVIRPTMSEYEKYRNTMLKIIANCKNKEVVILAQDILNLLHNFSCDKDIVDGTAHNLKRMAL